MNVEFRVWNEVELLGVFETLEDAKDCVETESARCAIEWCGTDGQEKTPGRGDFKCGTLNPHGIHIQVMANGKDVTDLDYEVAGEAWDR